jgi:nucleoside-diphosphate-sugar epimerase
MTRDSTSVRVLVAGASGAIGGPLVAQLARKGHEVFGTTRDPGRARRIEAAGGKAVVLDVFDEPALVRVLDSVRPQVVINQLTSIPHELDPRKVSRDLAATNRLRTRGNELLLAAAQRSGARRYLAQSIAFAYSPEGDSPHVETDPLFTSAPTAWRDVITAVATLERAVLDAECESVVLRYGFFTGPGTGYASDGHFAKEVQRRRVPIVGDGAGVFSFVHVEDAAAATVLAATSEVRGIYNIVDDDPMRAGDWLPAYARSLSARRPFRVPKLLARILAGSYAVYLMSEQNGASNAKAKRELGWRPMHPAPGFDA